MVLTYRKANGHRVKCVLPLPLIMGFVVGILTVYAYRLLLGYEEKKSIPTILERGKSRLSSNYHQVDLARSTVDRHHSSSLLCLIFIDDIDSVLMQHNVWLDKCGKNIMYVSNHKFKYIENVVTDTYSTNPWKYYCQTLVYLHRKYNYGVINKYDWFFLANDNVWLIYENLIHLIALLNPNKHHHSYYAGQYIDGVLGTNAGVLLSTKVLSELVNLFDEMDACDSKISNSVGQILDFYLKKLNNIIPVSNMDSYGCSLFHSVSLSETFNVNDLSTKMSKMCMSKFGITFQLGSSSNSVNMFYKYALYKVRLVTEQDLMFNATNILPVSSPEDENIWWIEALYELNFDPRNMSQANFFRTWSKQHQIIL